MSDPGEVRSTQVEIFGSTYVIRGGQEPEYLMELAAEVDRRMRELAGHVTNADPGRLAILAALNLADELSRNRQLYEGDRDEIEAKVTELADHLAEALEES
ncbi:MAG TPA: cell division protein ZapA [Thermoanaerobaculia bacterium]|nr:cell division protein ZapA [Thermoanaerobaculia bacterium]